MNAVDMPDLVAFTNDVTAALAPLTHLPKLRGLAVYKNRAYLYLDTVGSEPWPRLLPLAQWAYAFDVPVEINLSYDGEDADATVRFELGGRPVMMREPLTTAHAYELGKELGLPLSKDTSITLLPGALQGFIAERTAATS